MNIVSEYPHIQRASENSKHVGEILTDTYQLLSKSYSIIGSSAQHIYHSALSFTPPGTCLYQTYSSKFPSRIIVKQGVQRHWGPLVAALHGHSNSVYALSFSPDGSRLASGSGDKTLKLWDVATGVPIATLEGHTHSITSLSFSPNGSRLASGSYDNTVRLWGDAPIATLKGHSDFITSLSFSPDSSRLASGSDDSTVRLWDGSTGEPITTLDGHSSAVTSVSFSPDGSRLASGSDDTTVRLWNSSTGVPTATLGGHSRSVTSLSFSPDGSRLASGSDDGTVILWDSSTGGRLIATLEGHSDFVMSLSFTPDGSRLTSGSYDNKVILWDCATGVSIAALEGDPQSIYSLSRSPRLASMSSDTILGHRDNDVDGSNEVLFMSLLVTKDPSRRYSIQGIVPSSNGHVPLLWLPVDTAKILGKAFCSKAAAFGCRDGRVIILDLTQINL